MHRNTKSLLGTSGTRFEFAAKYCTTLLWAEKTARERLASINEPEDLLYLAQKYEPRSKGATRESSISSKAVDCPKYAMDVEIVIKPAHSKCNL